MGNEYKCLVFDSIQYASICNTGTIILRPKSIIDTYLLDVCESDITAKQIYDYGSIAVINLRETRSAMSRTNN